MIRKTAFLILVLFSISIISFVDTAFSLIPLPIGQQTFTYNSTVSPVKSMDPAEAKPIGVGTVAQGGNTISIRIGIGQFSGPVDIYFGIYAPAIGFNSLQILKADNTFQPLSMGPEPWKENITKEVDESLFGDILVSGLPDGTYGLHLAVAPSGSLGSYYFWSTDFVLYDTTVLALVQKYRDQVHPTLPADELYKIEQFVATYPFQAPIGKELFYIEATDDDVPQLKPVINRRDWAYAAMGITYTFLGALGEGQAAFLDVGFWCFLEAALLRPDEPEHLVNVAFHLNEREQYVDARTVLRYALSLDEGDPAGHNNLAYAYAGLGDFNSAITEALNALMGQQGVSLILERLAYYYEAAGLDTAAKAARAMLDDSENFPIPIVSGEWLRNLSEMGWKVYSGLNDLWNELGQTTSDYALQVSQILIGPHWEPGWIMTPEESSYYYICCPGGECYVCVPGALPLNLGHYILSSTFRYYCLMRVGSDAYCGACVIAPLFESINILQSRQSRAVAIKQQIVAYAVKTGNIYHPQGMSLINEAALEAKEKQLLMSYWDHIILQVINYYYEDLSITANIPPPSINDYITLDWVDWCVSEKEEEQRRLDEERHRYERERELQPYWDCPAPFCGKMSLPLGLVSVELNMKNGLVEQIEFSAGQGVQIHFGWNLRRNVPIVGFGYGANLDKVVELGTVLKYNPSGGLSGSVDVGPAIPVILPGGTGPPSISIAKFGKFIN